MHKYEFHIVGTYENYFYIDMVEDSSKFFPEARNIRDRNENIFSLVVDQFQGS